MRGIIQEAQRGPKVRKSLPPVGANQSLAALPRLPGRQGRAAHTALPGTDFRSIRYIFISADWYYANTRKHSWNAALTPPRLGLSEESRDTMFGLLALPGIGEPANGVVDDVRVDARPESTGKGLGSADGFGGDR